LKGKSHRIGTGKSKRRGVSKTPLKRIGHWRHDNGTIVIDEIDNAVGSPCTGHIKAMVNTLALTNGIQNIVIAW